jgi:hypothetical protein
MGSSSSETPPWGTLLLVCSSCKGARRGPDPGDVRKLLKKRLGKPRSLRVAEVDCLKLCPDDAVAVCLADADRQQVTTRLVASEADLEHLAAELAARHAPEER